MLNDEDRTWAAASQSQLPRVRLVLQMWREGSPGSPKRVGWKSCNLEYATLSWVSLSFGVREVPVISRWW